MLRDHLQAAAARLALTAFRSWGYSWAGEDGMRRARSKNARAVLAWFGALVSNPATAAVHVNQYNQAITPASETIF